MSVEILKIKEYWEKNVPMAFKDIKLNYEEKRKFRRVCISAIHKIKEAWKCWN